MKGEKIYRRLFFYLIGVLIGSVLSFAIFGNRFATYFKNWLPEERVKNKLKGCSINFDKKSKCVIKCLNIKQKDLINKIMLSDIIFSESKQHSKPCPVYKFAYKKTLYIIIKMCNKTAVVQDIYFNQEKTKCKCN